MGTVRASCRKDGTTGYTSQIRPTREGRLVHPELEAVDLRALAER